MSYAKVVYLYCDPCRELPAQEFIGEPFRIDPPASIQRGDEGGSVRVEREDAKQSGWHFVNGRDVCDQCWEAGRR